MNTELKKSPAEAVTQSQVSTQPNAVITFHVCDFTDVLPLWHELWPGRQSQIEPASALKRTGGYDMLYLKNRAWFVCARRMLESSINGSLGSGRLDDSTSEIIGVSSGHITDPFEFRIRGTYVKPQYQHRGLGQTLIKQLLTIARSENCKLAWTMPRTTSLKFYEACGFEKVTEWSNEFEFGPHCVAMKKLF
jgi:GNAT superfamily N-acetyltransferase